MGHVVIASGNASQSCFSDMNTACSGIGKEGSAKAPTATLPTNLRAYLPYIGYRSTS